MAWKITEVEVQQLIALNNDILTPERLEHYKMLAPIYYEVACDYCNATLEVTNNGVKVFVAKEQLEKLYENIESNCAGLEKNSSEKFFAVGPFSADEVSNSRLIRFYGVIYHPDIEYPDEYTKEYMRINTFLYVYECSGSYYVYLETAKTFII